MSSSEPHAVHVHAPPRRDPARPRPSPEPFFLVGFQRSGTTLLRLMLNAHPDLAIPHDSAELWLGYRARLAAYNHLREPADARRLVDDLLSEARIHAWQTPLPRELLLADPLPADFAGVMARFHGVFAEAHGKRRWGDKNTGTLTELDQLNAMFPSCKIVHIVRDGRDCALSHLGDAYVFGYENVLRVAVEWRDQVTLCRKMGAMLPPGRFIEIRYEDLLASPEGRLREICGFLGEPFSPAMLQYHQDVGRHVPDERRSLWPLLDRPPVVQNAFKWKSQMSPTDRAVFERNAGSLLRELGYETLPGPVHRGQLRELWYLAHSRIAWRLPSRRRRAAARARARATAVRPPAAGA